MTMDQKNALIERICADARILPVITIGSEEQILPLADALAAGGLRTLEITLRSSHGLTAIRRLREERPDLCIGAGTVLDRRMMDEVEAAGAQARHQHRPRLKASQGNPSREIFARFNFIFQSTKNRGTLEAIRSGLIR